MSSVGGLLGLNGGAGGTGISGPSRASIVNPVTQDQINESYNGTQNAMAGQQNLLTALQGQNGLANQSQVYGQLQGVVNGTGPNPAQTMLNQATGQNVANQAALMAGQRGASGNVGLMARQAAQAGAQTQQNAAGQAATLQANQSLNALNQAGGVANTQAGNQINQTNQNVAASQNLQNALLNAQNGFNTNQVASQNSVNAGNTALAGDMLKGMQAGIGGAAQGAGMALAAAEGGEIPRSAFGRHLMSSGGKVPVLLSPGEVKLSPEEVAKVLKGASPMSVGEKIPGKPNVGGAKNSYSNDTVPSAERPGTIIVPRSETKSKDADKKSADFVAKVVAKRKVRK